MIQSLKILAFAGAILLAFLAYRYYVYESEDNLRAGLTAFKSGDYKQAYDRIAPYSSRSKLAQETLAKLYAYGLYPERDFVKAEHLFGKASENDEELSKYAYYVGVNYLEGSPLTKQDNSNAQYWMELADRLGSEDARNFLQRENVRE